jgi:hypothetical protein
MKQSGHKRKQLFDRLKMRGVARLHVLHPPHDAPEREIGIRPKVYEKSPAGPCVLIGRLPHLLTPKVERPGKVCRQVLNDA